MDYVPAGGKGYNFGWNLREGTHPYEGGVAPPGAVEPLFDFPHDPDCSVTGGYVYRGTAIAELAGRYVFTDYCNGVLRTYDGASRGPRRHASKPPSPSAKTPPASCGSCR